MLIRDKEVKVGKHLCGSLMEDYIPMKATHGLNGTDDSIQDLPMLSVVETLTIDGLDNALLGFRLPIQVLFQLPKVIAPSPPIGTSNPNLNIMPKGFNGSDLMVIRVKENEEPLELDFGDCELKVIKIFSEIHEENASNFH
ncbi:hypothetical protein V6N12_046884 [Hibiscus sabdariffa]